MKRVASVPGAGLLLVLGVLCASGGCANFEVEGTNYCNRNPEVCQEPDSSRIVSEVAAGGTFTLALLSDQSVSAWGDNFYGQLGDGSTTSGRVTPLPISGLTGVDHIAAGYDHALALIDGNVWSWGVLPSGVLQPVPKQVSGLTDIKEISAGYFYSLALHQSGSVRAWGGNRDIQDSPEPVEVQGLSNIVRIAAGGYHALALDTDGVVWAWGSNDSEQLGNSGHGSATPEKVEGLPRIEFIAAGMHHSLAVDTAGKVWAWGGDYSGELGDGETFSRFTPMQVSNLVNIKTVAAGGDFSMAVSVDGDVFCWGSDMKGQLGNDPSYKDSSVPVKTASLTSVQQVSAGFVHSMALLTAGTLWAWGANEKQQLGVADMMSADALPTPSLVSIP